MDRLHRQHCPAPVEDLLLCWGQHRDRSGHLRGTVDVLRFAKHRADTVQSLRLLAESEQYFAGNPSLDGNWHPAGADRNLCVHHWHEVHEVPGR